MQVFTARQLPLFLSPSTSPHMTSTCSDIPQALSLDRFPSPAVSTGQTSVLHSCQAFRSCEASAATAHPRKDPWKGKPCPWYQGGCSGVCTSWPTLRMLGLGGLAPFFRKGNQVSENVTLGGKTQNTHLSGRSNLGPPEATQKLWA